MNKLAAILILAVSLAYATPSSAFLIVMTEAEMRAAFCQAGVSVEIEYMVYEHDIREIRYTDEDGTDGSTGYIIIRDQHIRKIYTAIYSEADFIEGFIAATTSTANPAGVKALASWRQGSPLTIDTGLCKVISACLSDSSQAPVEVTGVVAGLPTLIVNTTAEDYSIAVSKEGAINDNMDYIHVKTEGNVSVILGGAIEIAAR